MNATPSELLMRNFNEIFIELDPVRRAELLSESYTKDCLGAAMICKNALQFQTLP